MRTPDFEVRERVEGDELIVAAAGELDLSTVPVLAEALDGRPGTASRRLALDLGALEFMDSSGLRLLIELAARAEHEGWALRIRAPRAEAVLSVLRTTRADAILPLEELGDPPT